MAEDAAAELEELAPEVGTTFSVTEEEEAEDSAWLVKRGNTRRLTVAAAMSGLSGVISCMEIMCFFTEEPREKQRPQPGCGHLKGFSPVCVIS